MSNGDEPDYPRVKPEYTKKQEGGDHYKGMAIEPLEFILANKIAFSEGSVIRYVVRHRAKGGKQDLLKAIHYLEAIIEHEYSE